MLSVVTISTTLENSIITERTTKNMAKYQKFVISFRVSFNNFHKTQETIVPQTRM